MTTCRQTSATCCFGTFESSRHCASFAGATSAIVDVSRIVSAARTCPIWIWLCGYVVDFHGGVAPFKGPFRQSIQCQDLRTVVQGMLGMQGMIPQSSRLNLCVCHMLYVCLCVTHTHLSRKDPGKYAQHPLHPLQLPVLPSSKQHPFGSVRQQVASRSRFGHGICGTHSPAAAGRSSLGWSRPRKQPPALWDSVPRFRHGPTIGPFRGRSNRRRVRPAQSVRRSDPGRLLPMCRNLWPFHVLPTDRPGQPSRSRREPARPMHRNCPICRRVELVALPRSTPEATSTPLLPAQAGWLEPIPASPDAESQSALQDFRSLVPA